MNNTMKGMSVLLYIACGCHASMTLTGCVSHQKYAETWPQLIKLPSGHCPNISGEYQDVGSDPEGKKLRGVLHGLLAIPLPETERRSIIDLYKEPKDCVECQDVKVAIEQPSIYSMNIRVSKVNSATKEFSLDKALGEYYCDDGAVFLVDPTFRQPSAGGYGIAREGYSVLLRTSDDGSLLARVQMKAGGIAIVIPYYVDMQSWVRWEPLGRSEDQSYKRSVLTDKQQILSSSGTTQEQQRDEAFRAKALRLGENVVLRTSATISDVRREPRLFDVDEILVTNSGRILMVWHSGTSTSKLLAFEKENIVAITRMKREFPALLASYPLKMTIIDKDGREREYFLWTSNKETVFELLTQRFGVKGMEMTESGDALMKRQARVNRLATPVLSPGEKILYQQTGKDTDLIISDEALYELGPNDTAYRRINHVDVLSAELGDKGAGMLIVRAEAPSSSIAIAMCATFPHTMCKVVDDRAYKVIQERIAYFTALKEKVKSSLPAAKTTEAVKTAVMDELRERRKTEQGN